MYQRSERFYRGRVPEIEYQNALIVRRVRHNGEIKWKGRRIYLSEALAGEPVGLRQSDEHLWDVSFSFYHLGILNEKNGRIEVAKGPNPQCHR